MTNKRWAGTAQPLKLDVNHPIALTPRRLCRNGMVQRGDRFQRPSFASRFLACTIVSMGKEKIGLIAQGVASYHFLSR